MPRLFPFALVLLLLQACPPAGDCVVDDDCGDARACREDPDGKLVCIQVVVDRDAGPQDDVAITSFSASPEVVQAGGTTTLTWTTENATSCALSGGLGGVDANGSVDTTVADTTNFTLNCQGFNGPATENVRVPVEVAVTSLTATPAAVDELGSITLDWTTVGAESCRLTFPVDLDEDVDVNGTRTFQPSSSADATLTCEGEPAPATETVTLALARVLTLTATPPAIAAGQSIELAWTEENAENCAIFGEVDPTPDDDLLVVNPAASRSYSLRCDGFVGELRRDLEAVVLIERFAAQNATVVSGADAVLEFDLDPRVASCTLDDDTVVDPGAGAITITAVIADFTRTLQCQDGEGAFVATSEPVTVTVQ